MFVPGSVYTKCGVMLEELHATENAAVRSVLPRLTFVRLNLLAAFDGLNRRFGRNTVRVASEGQGARSYDTKRRIKSPSWTTRIGEIPVAS